MRATTPPTTTPTSPTAIRATTAIYRQPESTPLGAGDPLLPPRRGAGVRTSTVSGLVHPGTILLAMLCVFLLAFPAAAHDLPPATHDHQPHASPPASPPAPLSEAERDAFAADVDLAPLRLATTQHDSTLKTLDTFSRQVISAIAGRASIDGQDPVYTVLDMAYRPRAWAQRDVLRIGNVPLRKDLADLLYTTEEDRQAFISHGRVSLLFVRQPQVQQALNRIEGEAVFKANAVAEFRTGAATLEALLTGGQMLPPIRVVPPPPGDEDGLWRAADELVGNVPFLAGPMRELGMEVPEALPGYDAERASEMARAAIALRDAWGRGDASAASQAASALAEALEAVNPDAYPSPAKRHVEVVYNRLAKLTIPGAFLYFAAFTLFLVAAYSVTPRLRLWGLRFMLLAFIVHTAGIAVRWWLVEKSTGDWFHSIPIKNQFESVLFSAWFGALVGLVLELRRRRGVGGLYGAAASFVGWLSLVALFSAPYVFGRDIGGEIRHVAGILMSYWLYIHVTTVVASYALIGMSFLLAVWWLTLFLTGRGQQAPPGEMLHPEETGGFWRTLARVCFLPVAPTGPTATAFADSPALVERPQSFLERLDAANLVVLQLAFWVLGAGIVFGAVWADVSWGRPWGWDPKETFALVTWLVYLIVIHVRLVAKRKALWTAILAVIGFFVMLFNWIGVNFFFVGLHSYA